MGYKPKPIDTSEVELAWIYEQVWARSEADEVGKETEGAPGCSGDAAIR